MKAGLTRWIVKAPLDFNALINEPAPAGTYANLDFSVLVIRGEHAPAPTRVIAGMLSDLLPDAALAVIAGAGHMGPLTHPQQVSAAIARHVAESEAGSGYARRPAAGGALNRSDAHVAT